MKTLKIALILLLTSVFYNNANAQILRNSFLIGGSMNFDYASGNTKSTVNGTTTQNSNDPTSIVFGISPRFGYFLADNFCLGLNLDFRINSTSQQNTTTTTRLITGPFARYYGALSDNVYLFGELSLGGGLDSRSVVVGDRVDSTGGIVTRTPVGTNVSVTNLQVGVGPGLNFFLNDYIAFEALAKYTYSNATYAYTDLARNEVKNSSIGNNVAVTLGLQIYFRAVTGGIKE